MFFLCYSAFLFIFSFIIDINEKLNIKYRRKNNLF